MAREDPQIKLRITEGMRDRIKAAADANNRSMNAEIVATLEEKYPAPSPFTDSFLGTLFSVLCYDERDVEWFPIEWEAWKLLKNGERPLPISSIQNDILFFVVIVFQENPSKIFNIVYHKYEKLLSGNYVVYIPPSVSEQETSLVNQYYLARNPSPDLERTAKSIMERIYEETVPSATAQTALAKQLSRMFDEDEIFETMHRARASQHEVYQPEEA